MYLSIQKNLITENNFQLFIQKLGFSHMVRRVSVVMDDDLDKKIRVLQAKTIQKKNAPYSYSKAVNNLLRKAI